MGWFSNKFYLQAVINNDDDINEGDIDKCNNIHRILTRCETSAKNFIGMTSFNLPYPVQEF